MADYHGRSPTQPVAAESDATRGRYDWSATEPSVAVVETASAALEIDPIEMTPLGDAIDSDALNGLYAGRRAGDRDRGLTIEFSYAGLSVHADGDGTVVVWPEE